MKKYLLIAIVALGLSLVACGGGKKAENVQSDDATPAVTAVTDSTQNVQTDDTVAPADSTSQDAAQ